VDADLTHDNKPAESKDVIVFLNDHEATPQPRSFQFCPLGVQFYMEKPLPECELVEFQMSVPNNNGTPSEIQCAGLVASCCADPECNGLYRIWVKFLDLPLQTRSLLQRLSHEHDFLCPFCENFR